MHLAFELFVSVDDFPGGVVEEAAFPCEFDGSFLAVDELAFVKDLELGQLL